MQVPWGEIKGKAWGPERGRPVLCLHGWADNCGTFNTLIPLLPKGKIRHSLYKVHPSCQPSNQSAIGLQLITPQHGARANVLVFTKAVKAA